MEEASTFVAFERFSRFFCDLFSQPGLLQDAQCRQSYKDYLPRYYHRIFGPDIDPLSPRHIKWYRRLQPLFSLPRGTQILDFGGGYGMDSIFLASLGYEMVFYEISPHHIGVARWFVERFSSKFGPIPIRFVLSGKDPEPRGLDAVLLNEVAHHIEPPQRAFDTAAAMLRPGGHLFLLEPNFCCPVTQAYFFKVRGFQTIISGVNEETGEAYVQGNENIRPVWTWTRFASTAGFAIRESSYIVPWLARAHMPHPSAMRRGLERLPLVRDVIASHVVLHYVKQ